MCFYSVTGCEWGEWAPSVPSHCRPQCSSLWSAVPEGWGALWEAGERQGSFPRFMCHWEWWCGPVGRAALQDSWGLGQVKINMIFTFLKYLWFFFFPTSLTFSHDHFFPRNFRASKGKGQEIGRLPSQEKIDCFTISFQPLRVELEIMNRRYWDILVQSLHNAIMKDINTIEKFTEEAIEVKKYHTKINLYQMCVKSFGRIAID